MRLFGDCFGKQPTLVKPHVPRGRSNKAADRMTLHVLRHIKANKLNTKQIGQLTGNLRLTNTGWATEKERTNGLFGLSKPRASHFNCSSKGINGGLLPKDNVLKVAIEFGKHLTVVGVHGLRWNTGNFRDDLLNFRLPDGPLLLALGQYALGGTGLVDDINSLIGQVSIVDVTRGQLGGCSERPGLVANPMMLFETSLKAFKNLDGLVDRRLVHVNFLEPSR